MFKDFSPAAKHIESYFNNLYLSESTKKHSLISDIFNKPINPKDIFLLKKDIYKELSFHFKNMNEIMNSSFPRKEKEKFLNILRDYAVTEITTVYYTSFEYNESYKESILEAIESYLYSMIDTKFKRCISSLRREDIPALLK